MRSRRSVLAGVGISAVGGLSGCLDLVTDEELEFGSEPARATRTVTEANGYEHQEHETIGIERTVEVSDQSRTVSITTWIDSYSKPLSVAGGAGSLTGALFSAISTPNFEVLGQSANPVDAMDHGEMIEEFSGEIDAVDEIEDVRLVDEDEAQLLGQTADLSIFEATVNIDGQSADGRLYVTHVEHEGDIVLAVGGYVDDEEIEALLDEDIEEGESIREMIQSVEHPVSPPE